MWKRPVWHARQIVLQDGVGDAAVYDAAPEIAPAGAETATLVRPEVPSLPRLERLRAALLAAPYELCTQKAELLTRAVASEDSLPPPLAWLRRRHCRSYLGALERQAAGRAPSRAQARLGRALLRLGCSLRRDTPESILAGFASAFAFVLDHMELRVYADELIVGNCSSRRIGAPLHPDYSGVLLAGELDGLPTRPNNPLLVDEHQRRALREEIFPAWFDRSVLALTSLEPEGPELTASLLAGNAFVLTQFAGISHVTPDYPRVLRLGFAGIEEEIRGARARSEEEARQAQGGPANRAARARAAFFDAALIVTGAARRCGKRWRDYLVREAERTQGERRRELLEMAGAVARVPEFPARTFREALQSLFLAHVLVHQESFQHGVSFGRLDQYLYPYYRADRDAGRITPAEAVELLGCFLVKAAEMVPLFFARATEYFSGLSSASGITLGGTRAGGGDAVNELSFLVLLAYDQVRLRQPNLHVRVHRGTAPAFLNLCGRVLARGGGMPAFFNDERIVGALADHGVAGDDAREYAIVGCAEWGVPGRSFPAAGAGFVSLPYALWLALHEGRIEGRRDGPRTAAPAEMRDLDAVVAAFRAQVRALLARATAGNNAIERVHARHRPTPFLSVLVDGCVASGRDVTAGGAIYNPTGFQAVGLADVVDSLSAIETVSFREGSVPLADLIAAADAGFAGREDLRARVLNRVPRYGEDDARADRLAALVSRIFVEELGRFTNPRGGPYLPGFWTMTTHQGLGRRLGGLPSGRLAGEALANGASPRCGSQRSGPTGALASAARVVTPANGCVVNQTVSTGNLDGLASAPLLTGLVRGFFEQGGAQLQVNVVDPRMLEAAREHPELHRDLVVRVSGYSAYFVDLTPEMQEEIIARAREAIAV